MYAGVEYLNHLRQSILPMGDPVVRGLLEVEERLQCIVDEEEENRKRYLKERRQSRKKRRIALKDEAIMRDSQEDLAKQASARWERVLRLFKL